MRALNKRSFAFDNKNQYGLTFDGVNEYATVAYPFGGLGSATSGTWSAWIKGDAGNTIMSIGNNTVETSQILLQTITPGSNILRLFGTNLGTTKYDLRTSSGMSLTDWTHVAVVHNATEPFLYVNGIAVSQGYSSFTDKAFWVDNITGANVFNIGANSTSIPSYYTGSIDEVSLWNTALTATEVLRLYNNGKPFNLKTHSKAANLVAHYRLGDAYAVHDGTNWQIPESKSGIHNRKSIVFDGVNEYVNIDSVRTSLAATTQGTWTGWVKPQNGTPTASQMLISFADTDASSYLSSYIRITNGKYEILATVAGVIKWRLSTSAQAFTTGAWSHFALVQDGVSPVLYVNGVAVTQAFTEIVDKTIWFSSNSGIDNGRIACARINSPSNSDFFNGSLEEIRFYNTALTAGQITALYNLGSPTGAIAPLTDANLVSHFRMGDAPLDSSTVVEDVYGNNNGVAVNIEAGDLSYNAPLLITSVNMEVGDLTTGKI